MVISPQTRRKGTKDLLKALTVKNMKVVLAIDLLICIYIDQRYVKITLRSGMSAEGGLEWGLQRDISS